MEHQLHKSCDTLPIYNFYKIIETADLNYLSVGYDDFFENKHEINMEDANSVFQAILTEYGELTSNRKALENYEKQIQIAYLEAIISAGEKILDNYKEFGDVKILTLLSSFDYAFDEKKEIENQVNMAIRKIKGFRNKVRILKVNYAQKFGKEQKKELKMNLVKEALSLELSLEMGREINIRTTSVAKWVYMIDAANERAKEYQKLKNK